MAVFTIQQAYRQLQAFVAAGQMREAESLYGALKQNRPDSADVLLVAAGMASLVKQQADVGSYVSQAVSLEPELRDPNAQRGLFELTLENFPAAADAYRRTNLTSPLNLNRLATALLETDQRDEAIACLRRAIGAKPDFIEALNNLGVALRQEGQFDESRAILRRAVALKPDFMPAINNLGNTFEQMGNWNDALATYQSAVAMEPNQAECWNNLGNVLARLSRFEESFSAYQRAVQLNDNLASPLINCGNAMKETGDWDNAMRMYQRAVRVKPGLFTASNYLIALNYLPQLSPEVVLAQHRKWAASLGSAQALPPTNDFDPHRRLRVGFVSGDFRHHVVGYNLLPLFDNLDHTGFEFFAYSASAQHDELTDHFRSKGDHWRPIHSISDAKAAQLIVDDRIDVLMDLSLHTGSNRLGVFAMRPAPLAGTFAGYPGTTGLSQIDFRLSDPQLDPPGETEQFYSERTIRLPHSFWCYRPAPDSPAVNELPERANGFITFGYLGNFCKINPPVLELWAKVMMRTPNSRLLLVSRPGAHRARTSGILAAHGIAPDRIEFVDYQPRPIYLALYNRVDIALDTFPYNSHTTGLDALWMGVPLVTKIGPWAIGRAGFSHLTNVGLPELAAKDEIGFVECAAKLAGDLPRLTDLRSTLRRRLQASPLMDEVSWARGIQTAIRQAWVERCQVK